MFRTIISCLFLIIFAEFFCPIPSHADETITNKDEWLKAPLPERNDAQSVEWMKKAYQAGRTDVAFRIGSSYDLGRYDYPDYAEALKWYRRGAKAGDWRAQEAIGRYYEDGLGVKKDFSKALYWYRLALLHGDKMIGIKIGLRYELGQGVPKNIDEAKKWYPPGYLEKRIQKPKRNKTLPPGAEVFIPADADIFDVQEMSLRGKGSKDYSITYTVQLGSPKYCWGVVVLGLAQDKLTLLLKKEYKFGGIQINIFKPCASDPNTLLLINNWFGDVGGKLLIFSWGGNALQTICVVGNDGFQVEDLRNDGNQELIFRGRYGPDDIDVYHDDKLKCVNFDYPDHYLPKILEFEKTVNDSSLPDDRRLSWMENGHWLPLFLFAGRIQEGLALIKKMRYILTFTDSKIASKGKKMWEQEFKDFEAKALIFQGNDKKKIEELKQQMLQRDFSVPKDADSLALGLSATGTHIGRPN